MYSRSVDREKIAQLGMVFRLKRNHNESSFRREGASFFELHVEANVIGTDNVILDRRSSWLVGLVKKSSSGVFLHMDPDTNRQRRFRVYTEYRSKAARAAIRKVEERLSQLVAPNYFPEMTYMETAIAMFEEVHNQLVVVAVIDS